MFFGNFKKKNDKEKDPRRFQTILLSVFFAIAIWLMIIYLNDPSIKITLNNVDVRFNGEAEMRERGFVITDKASIPSLSVSVSGKRSDLLDYMNNIYVSVDVNEINATGEYELKTSVEIPTSKITLEKNSTSKIKLEAEPLVTKKIQIATKQIGVNKSFIIKSEINENEIEISGAKNEIDKIAYGIATIDISSIHSISEGVYPYSFFDENDTPLNTKASIESQEPVVHIVNTPYIKKTLSVLPILSDELSSSYMLDNSKTVISPSTVEVGVSSEFTANHLYAVIDSASDSDSLYYLQDEQGLYIPPTKKAVEITPVVLQKQVKAFRIPITAVNLSDDAEADFIQEININVVCADDTEAKDITAEIDLTDLHAGTYKLPVKISGVHVESADYTEIDVTIRNK